MNIGDTNIIDKEKNQIETELKLVAITPKLVIRPNSDNFHFEVSYETQTIIRECMIKKYPEISNKLRLLFEERYSSDMTGTIQSIMRCNKIESITRIPICEFGVCLRNDRFATIYFTPLPFGSYFIGLQQEIFHEFDFLLDTTTNCVHELF